MKRMGLTMPSTLSHVRNALITVAVAGALAVTLSPAYRVTSLAGIASFAAEATGYVSGFHGAVDTATGRLAAEAPASVATP